MLNRMLRLHICKSNSRSVTVAKNVLASTSCLKPQENGPSCKLAREVRASTWAYKIHIVVKNVLFCTPYPQSHIQTLEATTGFAGSDLLNGSIPAAGFLQFHGSVFRVESGATPKAKTTHTHSMILGTDDAIGRHSGRDLEFFRSEL